MLKNKLLAVATALFLLISAVPASAAAAPAASAADDESKYADDFNYDTVTKILDKTSVFDLKAKSAILMDTATGKVLLERNAHEKLPIASITKIMSMLLIMEAIDSGKLSYKDTITVSEHSYNMGGSQVYLEPGEIFTTLEMLKAVAIHSANDATVALAEKVSGSEEVFVAEMNRKAKALGMKDTNFLDCTGLTDEGHYSSAYDVALMSRELVEKHPGITDITKIWMDTFRDGKFELANTNKLIRYYNGTTGLKTGFTSKAGYCLSATAKRNGLQLAAVVLGEADTNTRFAEAKKLLDYGFANFELSTVDSKGTKAGTAEIKKGLSRSVDAVFGEDVKLLLSKSPQGGLKRDVVIDAGLKAPIRKGQKVGTVTYKADGKEVGKAVLVSNKDVAKASFIRLFFRMVEDWIGIGR